MTPITYIRETISELKQVRWPTRQETIQLTLLVLVIFRDCRRLRRRLDFIFTNLLTFILK